MSLESKLLKMKGRSFMYKMVTKKVIDYKILEDEIIISTDKNLISIKLDKAEKELDQFLPAEKEVDTNTGLVKFVDDEKWKNLKDVAYQLIEKLNQPGGSEFLKVAAATNQTIASVVNLMKTEIEAVKLMNKI